MKRGIFLTTLLTMVLTAGFSATPITFDDMSAGTQIDMASSMWAVEKVDGTTMIAKVSSDKAKSGSNSLYILDNSSADKPYALVNFANGEAMSGSASFDIYIPTSNKKTTYVSFGTGKNNSQRYFELRLSGSGKVEYEAGSDDPDIAEISTDEWHTVTASWANGKFTIAIDGATVASNITVASTGLDTMQIPTTITFYAGDKSSTGTACYIDNVTSDLF